MRLVEQQCVLGRHHHAGDGSFDDVARHHHDHDRADFDHVGVIDDGDGAAG
jgi:hypothetical protein